jgi:hypothetical integral membrane protein (TIGR02206 family)
MLVRPVLAHTADQFGYISAHHDGVWPNAEFIVAPGINALTGRCSGVVSAVESRRRRQIRAAVVGLVRQVVLSFHSIAHEQWSVNDLLRLTDLATVAATYALWSQRRWAFVLTYYWGLTLSTQALISPVLKSPDFPNYQFLGFWAIHLLVVWAAIYLTWGRGMRPSWRSYRFVVVVTVLWAVTTVTFNRIAGTNYGFLNGKPHTASLLDVLGPWPVYLLTATALILIVWALMTWPWERTAL